MHIMIRSVLFTLLLFIFVFAQDTKQEDTPKIEFAEQSYDFGEITQDSIVHHVFKFTNTGNDTLKIHRVKSS